jgi:hypothetical protein
MIDWGNVPTGSAASLYWPQVLASDVLALADQFYSTNPLTAADLHTIQIPVTEHCLSYVPIPAGGGQNFAGLLTIELPLSVTSGQAFDVQVRRISTRTAAPPQPPPQTQSPPSTIDEAEAPAQAPAQPEAAVRPPAISWRYVVGTFQVRIPVTTGENILPAEESTLAIMKWRLEQIAPSDRWYPVLQRYIDYISARVDGLGGDAGAIPPSLTGYPPVIVGQRPEQEFTGKVCEVLFDCHGAFDGFVLEDCCRTRIFRSRERDIGQLALVACREQLTLAVVIDPARDDRICRLAIKR